MSDLLVAFADRFNLFTGIILLSIALYLRGVSTYHTPRTYEYAYALCGFSFAATGLVDLHTGTGLVSTLRIIRQLSVLVLGIVMFRHLLVTTEMDHPFERFREIGAYVLRNENDD